MALNVAQRRYCARPNREKLLLLLWVASLFIASIFASDSPAARPGQEKPRVERDGIEAFVISRLDKQGILESFIEKVALARRKSAESKLLRPGGRPTHLPEKDKGRLVKQLVKDLARAFKSSSSQVMPLSFLQFRPAAEYMTLGARFDPDLALSEKSDYCKCAAATLSARALDADKECDSCDSGGGSGEKSSAEGGGNQRGSGKKR